MALTAAQQKAQENRNTIFVEDGELICTGTTVLACLKRGDTRPSALPSALRELLVSRAERGKTRGAPDGVV